MPRKRTTRLQSTKKHGKMDVAVAENLSEKERTEQLQFFLKDYDNRVKSVLKDIEKKKRALLTFIQIRFEQQISDLPFEIKDMTLEDFAKCGGTFEAAVAHVRGSTQDPKQKKLAEIQNLKWNSNEVLEDITEEGSEDGGPKFAKPTTVKSKRQVARTASRTVMTKNSRFMTPANTVSQSTWGPTPLITPKFNPNLPVTPENIRDAKPGDKFMSWAGSPIRVRQNRRVSEVVDSEEMAHEWSDIIGMDLTPTRVEQMIRAVSKKMEKA
ncbi:hypothetical protein BsWGS_25412 [Bradybaena similaris]